MNNNNNKYKNAGFTLIDQMIVVSIVMILVGQALPSISSTLKKNQIASVYNEALAALNYARSIAVTTGSWATLCKSNHAGTACALSQSTSWANGWIVFEDANNNGVINAGERIHLQNNTLPSQILINYSRNKKRISYHAEGYAVGYNGKISFCDSQKHINKTMIISNSGRVRLAQAHELGQWQ
jgi:type IV fimbrial biogenesis protein FimT